MTLLVQREKHQCVVLKVLTIMLGKVFKEEFFGGFCCIIIYIFLDSSMVEHSAVNRVVVGSSPTRGADEKFSDEGLGTFFVK